MTLERVLRAFPFQPTFLNFSHRLSFRSPIPNEQCKKLSRTTLSDIFREIFLACRMSPQNALWGCAPVILEVNGRLQNVLRKIDAEKRINESNEEDYTHHTFRFISMSIKFGVIHSSAAYKE